MSSTPLKLTIELVPRTCFYSNVRTNVSASTWNKIRNKSYASANHVCEICGDVGFNQNVKHAVECHEIWDYNDATKVQKLTGLISLCPNCHSVKHAGKAQIDNKLHTVIRQLIDVNKMLLPDALDYLVKSFDVWRERSKHRWTLDISYLEEYMKE